MIAILDYEMGNLRSIQKKFDFCGIKTIITNNPLIIEKSDKLILPGVGHFKTAMDKINNNQLSPLLNYMVLEKRTPILGICLGMQLMAKFSEEGNANGLSWIDASVKKFNVINNLKYKVPHIGWNDIEKKKDSPLIKNINETDKFYFVHSYHLVCDDPSDIMTETIYEYKFTSSIMKNNIFGVQFHPEKSQKQGELILKNFSSL